MRWRLDVQQTTQRKRLRVELRLGVSPRQTLNGNGRNARVGKTAKNGERYKTISETEPNRNREGALIKILSQTQKCRPRHR